MMTERTRSRLSRADRPARSFGSYVRPDLVAIALGVVAVLVFGLITLREPARVSTLTLSNPSSYDVTVDVSSKDGHSWLPLAVLDIGATRDYSEVLDQGDTWVFRFRAQGVDGGQAEVTRHDLAAAGWKYVVPNDVIQRIQAAGAPDAACVTSACKAQG
jgi:hypothetical protein